MAYGGGDSFREDMQASALAYNLGKVSLGGPAGSAGKGRDVPAIKYELRDLEIQQTIGERSRSGFGAREKSERLCASTAVFWRVRDFVYPPAPQCLRNI